MATSDEDRARLREKYGSDADGYEYSETIGGGVKKFINRGRVTLSLEPLPVVSPEVAGLRARVAELEAENAALKSPKPAKATPKD